MLPSLYQSKYSLHNSFTFIRNILCVDNRNLVTASFDIVSLFMYIPMDETYNINTSKAFNNSEYFLWVLYKVDKTYLWHWLQGKYISIQW